MFFKLQVIPLIRGVGAGSEDQLYVTMVTWAAAGGST